MDNTNILSQFDIQAAEQAARDSMSIEKRQFFILQEMSAVILKDKEHYNYHDNNFDSEVIDEVDGDIDYLFMEMGSYDKPDLSKFIKSIRIKIKEGVAHSFRNNITELRQESLTLLKLNGLIEMLC